LCECDKQCRTPGRKAAGHEDDYAPDKGARPRWGASHEDGCGPGRTRGEKKKGV
jgi:hypothetical protein